MGHGTWDLGHGTWDLGVLCRLKARVRSGGSYHLGHCEQQDSALTLGLWNVLSAQLTMTLGRPWEWQVELWVGRAPETIVCELGRFCLSLFPACISSPR